MGRSIVMHVDEAPFVRGEPTRPGAARTRAKQVVGDEARGPWIGIVSQEPNLDVAPHSHGNEEVLYIIEGSMILQGKTRGPGTVIYVDKDTVYGFTVGPQGVRFLTVRPGPPEYKPAGAASRA